MANDLPVWSNRFTDNYYKSLVANLETLIDECDDPDILRKVGTTLKNGLGGRAINKARQIEGKL